MNYTQEQDQFIESDGNVVLLKALAGTGKTTSLKGFSLARPRARILYLTFNASMRDAAKGKFPANVKIMTTHGPAFRDVGSAYADSGKLVPGLRPWDIARALSLTESQEVPSALVSLYALRVKETLDNFLASADMELTTQHVSINQFSQSEIRFFEPGKLLEHAKRCWKIMADMSNKGLGMTHDGYLKIFQLGGYKLGNYDYVLLDEAQDSNPAALDIVMKHQGRKVLVGDSNQAIYAFRGAVDAMNQVPADIILPLQSSFRFGEAVEDIANHLLALNQSDIMLRGVGKPSEVSSDKFAPERNVTHVSRGNGYIFEQSFKAMRNGSRIGFLGGIKGYRFDLLEDVYRLYKADKPQDPFLRSFGSYEDLKLYAEDANDHDLARSARLIEEYTDRIPGMISKIASGAVEDLGKADVGFTTAHKAKGAEFERVVLADDYYTLPYNNGARKNTMKQVLEDMEAEGRTKEELNISYVAMTRAIKNLYLPESFEKLREIPNIQSHIEAVKKTQITTKSSPGSRQSGPRMSAL